MEIEDFLNQTFCCDCLDLLPVIPDGSVDMVMTSPPYDKLRTYKGYSFDFEGVARELYRVIKPGGAVVWVVADETVDGSETGTSFRQALHFKEIGFNLHDTMIWNKGMFSAVGSLRWRYAPVFEYMFVLTKGRIATFNPIKDRANKYAGCMGHGTVRNQDGSTKPRASRKPVPEFGQRFNVWDMPPEMRRDIEHPAMFPEPLARDHITSWSNRGDIVLDPFAGSGTTGVVCQSTGRNFIQIELAQQYCDIAESRLIKQSASAAA